MNQSVFTHTEFLVFRSFFFREFSVPFSWHIPGVIPSLVKLDSATLRTKRFPFVRQKTFVPFCIWVKFCHNAPVFRSSGVVYTPAFCANKTSHFYSNPISSLIILRNSFILTMVIPIQNRMAHPNSTTIMHAIKILTGFILLFVNRFITKHIQRHVGLSHHGQRFRRI